MATAAPKPGYVVSLFVSKTTPEFKEKDGYDTRTFPEHTIELARVVLSGEDLEGLLSDAKESADLVGTLHG